MNIIIVFVITLLSISPLWANNSLIEEINTLKQSMVSIETQLIKVKRSNTPSPAKATYSRRGAGVIIDTNGIIVTNTHTIINAPLIIVTTNSGKSYPASLIYANLDHDFALIQINPKETLIAAPLANSDSVKLGASVLVIGNSEINQNSIIAAHVTSLLQSKSQQTIEFVEINAPLHHGDSGGPVFDRNGRLLGIVMAQHRQQPKNIILVPANKIRHHYWQYK